jgi:hypothetical protein
MKLNALLLPIALLALGSVNDASAATCNASYTMTAVTAAGFSCTLGALTFSSFAALYIASGGAATPNETSAITVNISEATTGSDPFGTAASSSSPIYSVITNYTAGNTVGELQGLTGVVQYLVTDVTAGTAITEVDGAISGLAANSASGTLNKNICSNNQFEGGASPYGVCPVAETIAASGLSLTNPAGPQADGTPDFAGPFSLSTMGVYDGWTLDGGAANPSSTADVTSVENDFIETTGLSTTPEPGTFVLLGGALLGLGAIRRRKKFRI